VSTKSLSGDTLSGGASHAFAKIQRISESFSRAMSKGRDMSRLTDVGRSFRSTGLSLGSKSSKEKGAPREQVLFREGIVKLLENLVEEALKAQNPSRPANSASPTRSRLRGRFTGRSSQVRFATPTNHDQPAVASSEMAP